MGRYKSGAGRPGRSRSFPLRRPRRLALRHVLQDAPDGHLTDAEDRGHLRLGVPLAEQRHRAVAGRGDLGLARLVPCEWLEVWYNRRRRHAALTYRSPIAHEEQVLLVQDLAA